MGSRTCDLQTIEAAHKRTYRPPCQTAQHSQEEGNLTCDHKD